MAGRSSKPSSRVDSPGPGRPSLGRSARQAKVFLRASADDVDTFRRAAEHVDETISTFLCTAGRERAKRVLRDPQQKRKK